MSAVPSDRAAQPEATQNPNQSPSSPGDEQPIRPESKYLYLGDHTNAENAYGFRIYRTTYSDDDKWDRFMSYLKTNIERSLGRDEQYKHQLARVDWTVQSSPDLQDASMDQVRDHFIQWIDSGEEQPDNSSRFLAFVVVDGESLDSVTSMLEFLEEENLPLDEDDEEGTAYVKLVSVNEKDGDVPVCIQYLYPRVFSFVHGLGWEHIVPGEGEFSARP
ncbi:hypothetical protein DPSP01_000437 [Paraphaeosphaeria sporulosa]|uniref:Uncharacterized protein n=1 Tax=Paraphaeosphaeria sporulosa TaxID=1460663 RepID=A0A177C8T6_9PLEO|nr:uncharacterized protein CC84DRAFT_1177541 [Paraphaeosphaeria sporulosa]OAG03541.1 hypothetical protein CC84DRAFT_1177541 [Paraphaeosphaeria sporulosa]